MGAYTPFSAAMEDDGMSETENGTSKAGMVKPKCGVCGKPLTEFESDDGFCRECERAHEQAMEAGTHDGI